MGDRICIRLTDGEKFTPTFYGHWCGLRGLKIMIESVREPHNSIGGCMCNFIVKVKEGQTSEYSYDLWNAGECDNAADGDWGLWTYHIHLGIWTSTNPQYNRESMTNEQIEDIIRCWRPCLYRTCKCEHYGEKYCSTAYYERHIIPAEEKLKGLMTNDKR